MSKVRDIIDRWGAAELARDLNRPYTTVQTWRADGKIPYASWPDVARASTARAFTVSVQDIFDAHEADRLAVAPATPANDTAPEAA